MIFWGLNGVQILKNYLYGTYGEREIHWGHDKENLEIAKNLKIFDVSGFSFYDIEPIRKAGRDGKITKPS